MRGNTRLFRVPSSSAEEGFHVWQGGIYFKTRRSEGNGDLREAIRDALRECKVYEDDLPFMTQTVGSHPRGRSPGRGRLANHNEEGYS